MFGIRVEPCASSLAARILRYSGHFASILGVVTFRLKRNPYDGRLVAQKCSWPKWFFVLFRILIFYSYCGTYSSFIEILNISQLKILICVRIFCSFICAVVIVVMQFWFEDPVISLVNRLLRLFRRVNSLPGCHHMCYGGKRELILLLFAVLCLFYQCTYMLPILFEEFDVSLSVSLFCETYISVCADMICHICFVAYLSLGALYDQVNTYVRTELRKQLTDLKAATSRRQLKAAGHRLDECLAIYDEIQRVTSEFQRLFDAPLCFVLLFGFVSMALVAFNMLLHMYRGLSMWLFELKMLSDLLLLTVSIQGASSGSRVIRRLSLENYYVTERSDWHKKLEMFFSRLNYREFRVRPLGLFDVSNELILVFLSALVTYLTYIIQYGMQSQQF
ncbi:hypothetical protein ACLKA7_011306 [Drosophila subpalustris]